MRILLVTDAWRPQINGVVRTLEEVMRRLVSAGHAVEVVSPARFFSLPMPSYPEIRLALAGAGSLGRIIEAFAPDQIHIATEGPLGLAARKVCLRRGLPFTTSYHTRFPEYLRARLPVPLSWSYAYMRRFHNAGSACLVATHSIAAELEAHGFNTVVPWTRGVDRELFRPRPGDRLAEESGWQRPVFLNVGRLSVEKNLPAFLDLDLPGTKVVVGDGPLRARLAEQYRQAVFTGAKTGEELARHYAAADVFVFPSLTDTFGNVLLESLASGVPVAAFPVPGPIDVIGGSGAGVLDTDLRKAALAALEIGPVTALARSRHFDWDECVRMFIEAGGQARPRRAARPSRALRADA
ncbi:MAG: glycosyltransferase family 1 protein [Nitratireductor sp.]|nr:glycosyltransferase family 1 protein [Nitratireductor sp.]